MARIPSYARETKIFQCSTKKNTTLLFPVLLVAQVYCKRMFISLPNLVGLQHHVIGKISELVGNADKNLQYFSDDFRIASCTEPYNEKTISPRTAH